MPEIAPIVGEPVAYGMAVAMAFLYVFATFIGRYPMVLAHEGGHMLALVLFLRPIEYWKINDDDGGGTLPASPEPKWSPANLVIIFAAYAVPPLFGLGGAHLIADGNAWGVLVLTMFLCILALVPARKWGLAFLIPLLIVLGVGWTLIDGTPDVRAAVAVGIVWYLLLGGLFLIFRRFGGSSDSAALRKKTLVPGIVWTLIWLAIGLVCLIEGGTLLLARS
jgi:hypothetical protein